MILQINKLIKIKADTSKAIMIINKNTLKKEIDNFMQENNIKQKKYVPTCTKIIQQKLQKCNSVADKRPNKYLVNIKPTASKLNIYIKNAQRQ